MAESRPCPAGQAEYGRDREKIGIRPPMFHWAGFCVPLGRLYHFAVRQLKLIPLPR